MTRREEVVQGWCSDTSGPAREACNTLHAEIEVQLRRAFLDGYDVGFDDGVYECGLECSEL